MEFFNGDGVHKYITRAEVGKSTLCTLTSMQKSFGSAVSIQYSTSVKKAVVGKSCAIIGALPAEPVGEVARVADVREASPEPLGHDRVQDRVEYRVEVVKHTWNSRRVGTVKIFCLFFFSLCRRKMLNGRGKH